MFGVVVKIILETQSGMGSMCQLENYTTTVPYKKKNTGEFDATTKRRTLLVDDFVRVSIVNLEHLHQ